MSWENLIEVLIALVGGGALFKFLEKVWDSYTGRGKAQRDEWRAEIARLEERTKGLEDKVTRLEAEVEAWKDRTDEWRGKYQTIQAEKMALEQELRLKTGEATRCAAALRRLRKAVKCKYVDDCPFLAESESGTGEHEIPKEGTDELGDNA